MQMKLVPIIQFYKDSSFMDKYINIV